MLMIWNWNRLGTELYTWLIAFAVVEAIVVICVRDVDGADG